MALFDLSLDGIYLSLHFSLNSCLITTTFSLILTALSLNRLNQGRDSGLACFHLGMNCLKLSFQLVANCCFIVAFLDNLREGIYDSGLPLLNLLLHFNNLGAYLSLDCLDLHFELLLTGFHLCFYGHDFAAHTILGICNLRDLCRKLFNSDTCLVTRAHFLKYLRQTIAQVLLF